MNKEFKIGEKVTYYDWAGMQNGIVKSLHERSDFVYVVFNCDNDWDNYQNYTAALTPVEKLESGWAEDDGFNKETW